MARELPTPSQDADPAQWCRWAWLAGQTQCYSCLPVLRELIGNQAYDALVRKTALPSYWILSRVEDAIHLQETLLSQHDVALASVGIKHPHWWHEASWLDACQNWLGQDSLLDQAIVRILSWSHRPTLYARVPQEVMSRAGVVPDERLDWEAMWRLGQKYIGQGSLPGFEGFWPRHMSQWASGWLKWEEAVWRYRWRLREEERLVEWTHKKAHKIRVPDPPLVDMVPLPQAQSAEESITWMVLGLGYHRGAERTDTEAAAWDSIWSSWAASLNYALYEILSNVRITEWHIAGLSGSLRDSLYV
ncbi:MAG: hypothetical protein M1294_08370 [Firmicutes bacterium]|uniref:Uncharacterized protein n=1 Tax=Sulfobacillus benefaciens TaxID=453960 RepID=A0A2T2X5C3_9FIRM|nr:hypothetical protein [Bacillota bacterium]MCL5014221.1 hypothetical protein [Bacillota bacterium]PSR29694.1 MAG: hypothetical protein C7B43_07845 [Sulfobacillus benefaciens]